MDSEQPNIKKIYCVSFNQDCSCLAVGHDDGYSFYSLRQLDRLEKIQDSKGLFSEFTEAYNYNQIVIWGQLSKKPKLPKNTQNSIRT